MVFYAPFRHRRQDNSIDKMLYIRVNARFFVIKINYFEASAKCRLIKSVIALMVCASNDSKSYTEHVSAHQ